MKLLTSLTLAATTTSHSLTVFDSSRNPCRQISNISVTRAITTPVICDSKLYTWGPLEDRVTLSSGGKTINIKPNRCGSINNSTFCVCEDGKKGLFKANSGIYLCVDIAIRAVA